MAKKKTPELDFEQQLDNLESIVDQLESGDLTLEQSIEQYQVGVQSLKALHLSMSKAEQKVTELSADLRGEIEELEGNDDD
ncbi:MAG: exodeoxyribonuclease VII small subunit [Planctomycetes bacterium]|nr:exodeoxyribonuclease VII small subunit [Planctomycetota bacterium]